MTKLGAGLCRAGTSKAGYGDPTQVSARRRTIWKDENNTQGQVRLIDTATGDYKFSSDGLIVGGNGIEQMVYLALVTVKGTSAVRSLGQNFSNIRTLRDNVQSEIQEEVRLALDNLVEQKKISIENVFVDKFPDNPSRIRILIQWKDLTANLDQASQVII